MVLMMKLQGLVLVVLLLIEPALQREDCSDVSDVPVPIPTGDTGDTGDLSRPTSGDTVVTYCYLSMDEM